MSIPDDLDGPIDNRVNEALASAVPTQMVEDAFAAILRLCLTAKEGHCLVVLDWNAIEPRIRAWLSDDWEHLDRWRAGEDLYSHLIGTILNRKITKQDNPELRDVGKIADVGCGYQMGAVAFERFCQAYRMDLSHLGLTATDVVRAYRKRYHRLSACPNGLWSRLEGGALRALQSGEHMVGQVCFRRSSGGHLDVVLPNDSFRRYWHPTVLVRPPPWAKPGDDSHNRPTLFVARSPEEQPTNVMYGGRWLENICQSIGRELLMDLLNRAESRGFPCVAHCHDEGVFEVPEQGADSALRSLLEMAQEAPEWAAGLPLRAEGFICPFWSKSSIDWYRSNDH
jgi:DNA polymerase